jgi:hypothetical protein
MKPTPQISSNQEHSRCDSGALRNRRSLLHTDCQFQPTASAVGSSSPNPESRHDISELRTFRKLSREFLGAESSRDYAAEISLFTLIAGVSAWPIISMIVALSRMVK